MCELVDWDGRWVDESLLGSFATHHAYWLLSEPRFACGEEVGLVVR